MILEIKKKGSSLAVSSLCAEPLTAQAKNWWGLLVLTGLLWMQVTQMSLWLREISSLNVHQQRRLGLSGSCISLSPFHQRLVP